MDFNTALKTYRRNKSMLESYRRKADFSLMILRDLCTHEDIHTDTKYYPGGFDYVSTTYITKTCKICDKELSTETKHGSFYQ